MIRVRTTLGSFDGVSLKLADDYLVGGLPTPLNMMGKNVPNHQPVIQPHIETTQHFLLKSQKIKGLSSKVGMIHGDYV